MTQLLTGRRILVVEDEMMILIMIENMLADLGCEHVSSAATIDQALSCLCAHSFDAACIDVNLNGIESYPIADALAARGVPFAFSTGYSDHGLRECYSQRPVLTKPYRLARFAQVIGDLISERARPSLATA